MSGGLSQLVAVGAQDEWLTMDPTITFFKVEHKRHTNFAVESIEQTFAGTPAAGAMSQVSVARSGDLLHSCWLEIKCNGTALGANKTAYDCISRIQVQIGTQYIDSHSGEYMKLIDDLRLKKGKRAGLDKLVKTDASTTQRLRIPLSFWFCREPGLALPLIALQYHDIRFHVEFSADFPAGATASIWCDYIFLDQDERQQFSSNQHEYLIEQVQYTDQSLTGTNASVSLHFNHPVKELIWQCPGMTAAKLQFNGQDRFAQRDADYFEYVQRYQHHSSSPAESSWSGGTATTGGDKTFLYSFALMPEEHSPSGTCNMSRIDNINLNVTGTLSKACVWAINYNVFQVASGMGGVEFAN